MRAVMYGAGNIGRGFIGQLFAASGFTVTFIDIAESVIAALNQDGRYPVRILSGSGNDKDQWVEGVSAVNGNDMEKAAATIACADIMATAVGVRTLPFIAPVIATGIKKRFVETAVPLNIIICENLIDADKLLTDLITKNLNDREKEFFESCIGLVEASIGRMVPLQTPVMQGDNPLRVCVEAYSYLPVDKAAFKGDIPCITNMIPCEGFSFYIKRKLFIHNMGHAICAYLGLLKGEEYIHRTILHTDILCIVQNAMLESAEALSLQFNIPLIELEFHIRDLLRRFANEALGDTCARVGGDTVRKLGPGDRLLGAWQCCEKQDITPAFISIGIAVALYHYLEEQNIAQTRENAATVLEKLSALATAPSDAFTGAMLIYQMYELIMQGADLSILIALAFKTGARQVV